MYRNVPVAGSMEAILDDPSIDIIAGPRHQRSARGSPSRPCSTARTCWPTNPVRLPWSTWKSSSTCSARRVASGACSSTSTGSPLQGPRGRPRSAGRDRQSRPDDRTWSTPNPAHDASRVVLRPPPVRWHPRRHRRTPDRTIPVFHRLASGVDRQRADRQHRQPGLSDVRGLRRSVAGGRLGCRLVSPGLVHAGEHRCSWRHSAVHPRRQRSSKPQLRRVCADYAPTILTCIASTIRTPERPSRRCLPRWTTLYATGKSASSVRGARAYAERFRLRASRGRRQSGAPSGATQVAQSGAGGSAAVRRGSL